MPSLESIEACSRLPKKRLKISDDDSEGHHMMYILKRKVGRVYVESLSPSTLHACVTTCLGFCLFCTLYIATCYAITIFPLKGDGRRCHEGTAVDDDNIHRCMEMLRGMSAEDLVSKVSSLIVTLKMERWELQS